MSKYVTILDQEASQRDYFSPSQISTYRQCKICWAFKYLDKREKPENFAAKRGQDLHKLLEQYLDYGIPIKPSTKYGQMLLAGIKHLPKPGTAKVEQGFVFEKDGFKFGGYIDMFYKDDSGLYVCDHKTTKSFNYALTPQALKNNIQANIYAAFILSKFQEEKAFLKWIYYKTAGVPESRLVQIETDLPFVMNYVSLVLNDCKEMQKAKLEGKTASDFDPPVGGCRAFGQCAAVLVGTKGMKMTDKRQLSEVLEELASGINPPKQLSLPTNAVTGVTASPVELLKDESLQASVTAPKSEKFTLLIDCIPRKGINCIEFMDFLKPVFKRISTEKSVGHYNFIPYEGRAVFLTTLDKYLDENPQSEDVTILLNTSGKEGQDAIDIMISHAGKVVQGVK